MAGITGAVHFTVMPAGDGEVSATWVGALIHPITAGAGELHTMVMQPGDMPTDGVTHIGVMV